MVELFRIGFLSITVVDILDIGIVSLLFYALYRVLKDTVAVQILLGFVLILAFSVITQSLNLKALNWILRAIPVNLCLKQVYIFSIGEFGSASNVGYHVQLNTQHTSPI